jgi:Lrp/AsnC family transcriptional regulator, leucine-responsive regulatory protein
VKVVIDRTDLKLLEALQTAGRTSNQDLAARIDLSPSACLARVRRLERDGVIRRYLAEVSLPRLGSHLEVFAEVSLDRHGPGDLKGFAAAIAKMPEVVQAFQLSGACDYLLRVVCRDMTHYRAVHDRLTGGEYGVVTVESNVVMEESKPFAGYPIRALVDGVAD